MPSDNVSLKKMLNQLSKRNRYDVILIDISTRELVNSFTRHRRFKNEVFDDFNQHSSPLMLEVGALNFVGPGLLKTDQID
jgi:hypothetical protein